jgi:hypothetical protein
MRVSQRRSRKSPRSPRGRSFAAPAEAAAPDMAAVAPPRLVHPPQHRMHIDYAYSILLRCNKELYYLIIVIGSIAFTWESHPSPTRSEPEDLIYRTYAHWPDVSDHTAWEKLDELETHSLCHNLKRDRHVFGSYVTDHLLREHPHVADTTRR